MTVYMDKMQLPDAEDRAKTAAHIALNQKTAAAVQDLQPLAETWLAENRSQMERYTRVPSGFDPDLAILDVKERAGPPAKLPKEIAEAVRRVTAQTHDKTDSEVLQKFFGHAGLHFGMFGSKALFNYMSARRHQDWDGCLPLTTGMQSNPFPKVRFLRLVLSPELKQIAFCDHFDWEVLPYSSLLEARLLVDEKTIVETSSTSQSAGIALGHAMFSSGTAQSTSVVGKYLNKITIQIRVADSDRPLRDIVIADYEAHVPVEDAWSALQGAEVWIARFQNIIDLEQKVGATATPILDAPPSAKSPVSQTWDAIKHSLDPGDYADFLEAFRGTQEAMFAARHKRQLETWAAIDKSDAEKISALFGMGLFPELDAHVRKVLAA